MMSDPAKIPRSTVISAPQGSNEKVFRYALFSPAEHDSYSRGS